MHWEHITTLGLLKESGYQPRSIKEEMRDNLIKALKEKRTVFEGIHGYDDTVIPQLYNALLARHNILLLGLRGQAKTRLARAIVSLLDEYIPIVHGSEINDDPFRPVSRYARDLLQQHGADTPIAWLHRSQRYVEKLATPDVTVADLIGDVDPIRAATLKLPYSDERVLHFGLLPRANRCVFVLNELPDLQARIQVALFNILEEGDIQIRGFVMRLPLDIAFVFTANPEDYTHRGSIVTPLKDRLQSQIFTHYPTSIEVGRKITEQEAQPTAQQLETVFIDPLLRDLIEEVAVEARSSDYVDKKSGVSARLTIAALELLYSNVERRLLLNGEAKGYARFSDLYAIIPAMTGKMELVYEGETEGITKVAVLLLGKAIRKHFSRYFPNPENLKKAKAPSPYTEIIDWFNEGNTLDLYQNATRHSYERQLARVPGLRELVKATLPRNSANQEWLYMEYVLYGLSEYSLISRVQFETGMRFSDILGSVIGRLGNQPADEES